MKETASVTIFELHHTNDMGHSEDNNDCRYYNDNNDNVDDWGRSANLEIRARKRPSSCEAKRTDLSAIKGEPF